MDYIIIKTENEYQEYPIQKKLTLGNAQFGKSGPTLVCKEGDVSSIIPPFEWQKDKEYGELLFLQGEGQAYERKGSITIANHGADICIPDLTYSIVLEQDKMYLTAEQSQKTDPFFVNGKVFRYSSRAIKEGDVLLLGTCKLILFSRKLVIIGDARTYQSSLLELPAEAETFDGFPHYKRSPRLIKRVNTTKIEIQKAPEKVTMEKGSLFQIIITPLTMMGITVATSMLMGKGIYVLASVTATLMALIFSVVKFLSDRKECKEKEENGRKVYTAYLLKRRKEIHHVYQKEKEAYHYNYPTIVEIERMITHYSSRIYERSSNDDDFLTLSLGTQTAPVSFSINIHYDEMALERDELEQEAYQIKEEFSYLSEKPVVIDLKKANLGLVGEKDNIHEQLKLMIGQLTFFQSYHDLEIIAIYNEKYNEDFKWMRWYPHLRIKAMNVLGNINSERMRDQVLGSIHQLLRERKQKLEESKKEGRFLPHLLFLIDEPKLIMDHSIMEYLGSAGSELGFSIIYTSHLRANLPDNMGTVMILENSQYGRLLLEEKEMKNQLVTLCHVGDVNLEFMARNLGVLIHEQGIVSQIPQSITFFEMYQVEHPIQLKVRERWRKNESHKTLAVPLGVRAVDDYVYLNLHEKAHGPHGLVAGTTGSGKSEIVQSYILSLAVNFHPYEVGFLLIDYKGGGMAGLFKDLPHLLGTITNLDGSESMRAMASIKSELTRRQRVFSENNVNHINAYNKLFKLGKVKEPIPHLFLISDEFAELKKEQPEFMSELVSAARIGRSLGIHLILATQKPSGVVDDQIWTNSKFKLALKVQNEADSKEMLKTPDAASITQAGRAYLQVGNNEIYELFQSAWSGAAYVEEMEEETVDNRIYLVNDLGQGELINKDLSEGTEKEQIKATQLDGVVAHLKQVFQEEKVKEVKRPWLPSLPKQLVSPYIDLDKITDVCVYQELDAGVPIGLVDIPEKQQQEEYTLNMVEDGNIAIFGSSGFGKTVAMTTAMLSLAVKNSPEYLKFYILDFGNSALIQLKNLPHTADYLSIDDSEKIGKLVKIISLEVQERKRMFARVSAMNFDMYNRIAKEKIPAIILFIDNYDVVKEADENLEPFINQISRDGIGIGIYLFIGATRPGAVKFSIINNFKNKIALYMFDKTDLNTVVGRTQYPLGEIKGRALVKLEEVNQMQVFSPVEFENVLDYTEKVRLVIEQISASYTGKKAKGIPVLPEMLNTKTFKDYMEGTQNRYEIPIGLDAQNVEVVSISLRNYKQLIIGASQTGKTNLLKVILEHMDPDVKTYVIDDSNAELYEYQTREHISYYSEGSQMDGFLAEMETLIDARKSGFEREKERNAGLVPKQYYSQLPPVLVLVEEWEHFVELMKEAKNLKAEKIITSLAVVHICVITSASASKLRGFDNLSKHMKDSIHGILLGNPNEQTIFQVPPRVSKGEPSFGFVYCKGELKKIKIPVVLEESEGRTTRCLADVEI